MISSQLIDALGNTRIVKYSNGVCGYTHPIPEIIGVPIDNTLTISVITDISQIQYGYVVGIFQRREGFVLKIIVGGVNVLVYWSGQPPTDVPTIPPEYIPPPPLRESFVKKVINSKASAEALKMWAVWDKKLIVVGDKNNIPQNPPKSYHNPKVITVISDELKERLDEYSDTIRFNNPKLVCNIEKSKKPIFIRDGVWGEDKGFVFYGTQSLRDWIGGESMIRTSPLPPNNHGAYLYKNPAILDGNVIVMKNASSFDAAIDYAAKAMGLSIESDMRIYDENGLAKKYKKSIEKFYAIFKNGDGYSSIVYGDVIENLRIKLFDSKPQYFIRREILHFYYEKPYFFSSVWLKKDLGIDVCIIQNVSSGGLDQSVGTCVIWKQQHKNIGFYGIVEGKYSGSVCVQVYTPNGEMIDKIGDGVDVVYVIAQKDCVRCSEVLYSAILPL